jgi:hypothetical protein
MQLQAPLPTIILLLFGIFFFAVQGSARDTGFVDSCIGESRTATTTETKADTEADANPDAKPDAKPDDDSTSEPDPYAIPDDYVIPEFWDAPKTKYYRWCFWDCRTNPKHMSEYVGQLPLDTLLESEWKKRTI